MYGKPKPFFIAALLVWLAAGATVQAETLPVSDNLLAWFRADTGITADQSGYVSDWSDMGATVGGANDAVQADSTKQPQVIANASPMGDRPIVRFDGGDYLDIAASVDFEAVTLSWFAVYTAATQESGTQRVFETDDASLTQSSGFWGNSVYPSSDGSRSHAVYARNSLQHYKPLVSDSVPVSDFVVTSAVLNGTSAELNGNAAASFGGWLNGSPMPDSPLSDIAPLPTGNLGSRIGARANAESNFLTGDIAEILIYNTALSDTDRQAVEQYLSQKWFQSAIVPGDANNDGVVDGSDVTILAGNWQVGVGGVGGATWSMGDFNGDGAVDGSDVTILAGNWQYGVEATTAAVPEPSSIVLILSAVLLVMIRQTRRLTA